MSIMFEMIARKTSEYMPFTWRLEVSVHMLTHTQMWRRFLGITTTFFFLYSSFSPSFSSVATMDTIC